MSIFNKVTKTFQWGQNTVTMETGEIARQASGAVLVNIDDTVVLATVQHWLTSGSTRSSNPLRTVRSPTGTASTTPIAAAVAALCIRFLARPRIPIRLVPRTRRASGSSITGSSTTSPVSR